MDDTKLPEIVKPPKDPKKKLTYKQKRFAKAYIECSGNATEAVRNSYPNIKTDNAQSQMAHKLLTQCPNVLAEVERLMTKNGLTFEKLSNALDEMVSDGQNPTARNQAVRTSLELLKLIGSGSNVAVQVNINNTGLDTLRERYRKHYLSDEVIEAKVEPDTNA